MSTVLFVKANNRPSEQAVTVKLHEAFLESYKASHPEDTVIELDLFAEQLPYLDSTMITGLFKSARGFELTAEEQEAAAVANRYLEQFLAADKVVFSFPLWNFTLPAVLHTYIDYLSQAGKTFKYTAEGPVGLLGDKKVALLNARGGVYSEGPAAAAEMSVNLLTNVLSFWGVKNVTKVIVEGHNQFPDRSQEIVASGVEQAVAAARTF
ncbi:FMN-dependent NADH-azoreductase [Paenibacillus sp. UNCCL117]|uniref:FMN-dependent NADH-azoreductase n=1 Tax=unclassified Paenibacillus TaxID=185978 RepID=UPI00088A685E|nr:MULTISPECIES: FMN-dependent NADH-azoreductase [unclassified Paenibacillus]SDC65814.1 FMN-dependent NADH-azoreductase [Paenibacillus sp. cl123]SFW22873.1 FMN-dependent NADH-azoreductase [Paenibacillus sp. UNCCL117]